MKQPPRTSEDSTAWRRPAGVSVGTWRYAHEGSIAEQYDDFVAGTPLCGVDHEVVAKFFPPRTSLETTETILDLGCGTGRTTALLVDHGYSVLALDLSQPMLRELSRRALPGVTPVRCNLVQLDGIASEVAAGAVCLFSTIGMIQGRENRRAFLRHVFRIVRPGGSLLLHVHCRTASLAQSGGWKLLLQSWVHSWRTEGREYGDAVYPYRGLPDMFLHRFSRREIVADLRGAGWSIGDIWPVSLNGASVGKSGALLAGGYLIRAGKQGDGETGNG